MRSGDISSTFSREVELIGYVLDEPTLRRVDQYSRASLRQDASTEVTVDLDCVAVMRDGATLRFKSVDALLAHFQTAKDVIKKLGLDYYSKDSGRISVFFDDDGTIRFTAHGPTPNTEFVAEGLTREIKNCDQHYHWLARFIAFSRTPQWWLTTLLIPVSFLLVVLIAYYFYASRIGVNVDQSLLYEGNTYYQDVERAISSNSIEEKINILLKGQLKGFTNVSAVLANTQARIGTVAVVLIGMVLLLLALRSYAAAYPRAFFALGTATDQLHRLERKREIWIMGVALAFGINVAAGLFVAFFS